MRCKMPAAFPGSVCVSPRRAARGGDVPLEVSLRRSRSVMSEYVERHHQTWHAPEPAHDRDPFLSSKRPSKVATSPTQTAPQSSPKRVTSRICARCSRRRCAGTTTRAMPSAQRRFGCISSTTKSSPPDGRLRARAGTIRPLNVQPPTRARTSVSAETASQSHAVELWRIIRLTARQKEKAPTYKPSIATERPKGITSRKRTVSGKGYWQPSTR
jgi:hypothetical protein